MTRLLIFLCLAGTLAGQTAVDLKVAAVQFRSSFEVADNRDRIIATLERLADEGVRVAVFPECALTGYHKREAMAPTAEEIAEAEGAIAAACRRRGIAAVVGSIYRVNGKTFNSAVVIDAKGGVVERYGKVMLAGEKWATPGNHIALFDLEGVKSTVIICHDERYPELVRLPALEGARMVYYISSESGMLEESKLEPYRAQIMARAVENRVFVVAANTPADAADLKGSSHGQSRIIADDGNVLREAGYFREEVLVETLRITPGRLTRPLEGLMGEWWKRGVAWMRANLGKPLE